MAKESGRERPWEELMRAAQQGDHQAYHRLLKEVAPVVRRIASSRWGRFEGMEDLVQDVLLSIHSVRHTYDPGRPFMPWLATIIRNRMADTARRYARRAANEMAVEILPETFWDDGTNHRGEEIGDIDLLHRAIAGLPAGQRQAVTLLKLKEMSLKEAAAASGQSVAALKVAMHRALKSLRATMGRETKE